MAEDTEDNKPLNWLVYIIESDDQSLYTGITNNLEKRWQAHQSGKGGAKFFRGRKPLAVRWIESGHTRSTASKREYQVKRMSRPQKLELICLKPFK